MQFIDPQKQNELVKWFQASDVFVLPSHLEGFGLVALEAIASGTPVIASQVGGLVSLTWGRCRTFSRAAKCDKFSSGDDGGATYAKRTVYYNEQAAYAILHEHDEKEITKRVIALYESAIKGGDAR